MNTRLSNDEDISIQKHQIPLKCHRCSQLWEYGGKNKYVASCPHRRISLPIRKLKVVQTGQSLERAGQLAATASQSTGGFPNG